MMSRRPPDRTEQNRATLKQLVKLEANKSCADCKRNKHPRWASWNLGIFMCIRCSGIHRGMGTHISRVKSVDLDSWTDEQMANMLKWGNARANKYWENKLAEGHVPSENKIENFIRTKYDGKRWVMDGPMPDPSTLDAEGDDDVPLNVVREKASMERGASLRNGASSAPRGSLPGPPQARPRPQEVDLFGDDPPGPSLARPNTTEPAVRGVPPPSKAPVAPPKQTKPGESLLGLDFFGGASSTPPARPTSAASGSSTPGAPGRTDLKQSILSLYSSAPRQSSAPQSQQSSNAFSGMTGMQSPPVTSPMQQQSNAQSLAGMNDAFGGLSFASPPSQQQQQQPKSSPFANLTSPSHSKQPSGQKPNALSGGSFFDIKPTPPPKPMSPPSQPTASSFANDFGNDFGDFSAAPSPAPTTKSPPPASKPTSAMNSLFDMSTPAPPPKRSPAPTPAASNPPPISSNYQQASNAFNLSQPAPKPTPAPATSQSSATPASAFSNLSNMDAWGSNDAWSTPDPPASNPSTAAAVSPTKPSAPAPAMQTSAFDAGWGDSGTSSGAANVSVQQDEEFGAWGHASPVATTSTPAAAATSGAGKSSGGFAAGGQDDLFGNVWG